MSNFPPKTASSTPKTIPVAETPAFSTGGGGLKVSKAMKNSAIRPSPGIEKVNSAS
jgi:hypothetical protein